MQKKKVCDESSSMLVVSTQIPHINLEEFDVREPSPASCGGRRESKPVS